jgi:hypothetical protein
MHRIILFPERGSNLGFGMMFRVYASLLLLGGHCLLAADPGQLEVTVKDGGGARLPVRAWVEMNGEQHFTPNSPSSCVPYAKDRSFSCDGEFSMELPPGSGVLHVEKGKEWLPERREFQLQKGQTTRIRVKLKRWINLPKDGWYSADMHVHFGHDQLKVMRQLALADDVHLVPAFSAWLRGNEKVWSRDWPVWDSGASVQVDPTHWITRDNMEIERIHSREVPGGSIGATFIYNLARPVSADRFDSRFPTDAFLGALAREASPLSVIDTDKPSWGETVVGAALGVYDTAQVCHNHYHRTRTLPGGWGMIGPLAPDEKDLRERDELFHRTNRQYYNWLNCGIRMGVSGGSAMGVMAVPLGYSRVYVRVDGEFTPTAFWKALKEGRSFATSGPVLQLLVNGRSPGDEIRLKKPTKVEIGLRVRSIDSLDAIEVVQNGETVFSKKMEDRKPDQTLDLRESISQAVTRSGWIVARVRYRAPDGGLRQAHTSPVYLTVEDKPTAHRDAAEYNLRWIDRLIEIAETPGRYRSEPDKAQVLAIYHRARSVYESVAETASGVWGDE